MIYRNGKMKITVKNYDRKIKLEIPEDSDLNTVAEMLQGVFIALGWSENVVKSHIKKEGDE